MAHTDVSRTFVGVPKVTGGIWRYPQTVALPTTAYAARPAGGIRLGGVSDDGYTYTSTRDTEKKRDWNGDKVRNIQQSKDDTFRLTFIEFLNPFVMELVYGETNVTVVDADATHGTHIATKSLADVLGHYAYIIDTFDGSVKRRRCVPDAQVATQEDVGEKPGDWSVYDLTFDIFPDSQGVTSYTYTELGDMWVPTSWDVAITGSSGTYIATVDGASTSALAYNAATAAVTTALEGLPTVGVGNVTVTGTAAAYTVDLDRGGTLSAVGTGGADVTVTPA